MLQFNEAKKRDDDEHDRKMMEMQLVSQEIERKRIAADLHDSVGSLLWGAKLAAAFLERAGTLSEEQKPSYKDLMEILDESIHTVKRIAWDLIPEAFHYSGLSVSLASLCSTITANGLLMKFEEKGEKLLWNDNRALFAFRIVQELVSNCIKHSEATKLLISLNWTTTELEIEVCDNGKGFELGETRNGIGWWNINHRISQLQGEIAIGEPPTGSGSVVFLKIPLTNEK